MKKITTPLSEDDIASLEVGDQISVSGVIFTGRDAALPQLVEMIKNNELDFSIEGSAIMHTAVSDAGIAPTTSNKEEIESTMAFLSEHGVKMHIGKGMLHDDTVEALKENKSVFVITPPVAALLTSKVLKKECVLFADEGMEAMYKLEVEDIPGIVGVKDGKSIYSFFPNVCCI